MDSLGRHESVTEPATSLVKHHYQSLKRKPPNFRLLSIQPGTNTSLIKVTISTHRLSKAPEYEALSYVWGPPSLGGQPNLISVNDSPFEVTPKSVESPFWSAI
jgi:hypothetical protein